MEQQVVDWLNATSSLAFRLAAMLFVVLNAGAVVVLGLRRDRTLVQRWTSPWLAANLVLLGAGLGVPALAALGRLAVYAMAGLTGQLVTATE